MSTERRKSSSSRCCARWRTTRSTRSSWCSRHRCSGAQRTWRRCCDRSPRHDETAGDHVPRPPGRSGPVGCDGETVPAPGSVPSYSSPERAVRALARAVRYAAWRRRTCWHGARCRGMDVGGTCARRGGARPSTGRNRTVGGTSRPVARHRRIVLSAEVPPDSVEVVIGTRDDPSFGALASFGIAGVATELLGDRAYAPVPLTTPDAEGLVRAPRASPLLTGYSGGPPLDLFALTDVVLRLSALAEALPELAECTLHVLATPIGAQVASVSARVAPAAGARRHRPAAIARPVMERNVLGGVLQPCGGEPLTGFYRDSYCRGRCRRTSACTACAR